MIVTDSRGNELVEIIHVAEEAARERYVPVTHCLIVVLIDGEYLLGWNRWRAAWEIFGGCMEAGETMRECAVRECMEEIGISNAALDYIGLMSENLVPDYFSREYRREYGGLYGLKLKKDELQTIERNRQDREEIPKIALLKDIGVGERIAEIDRALLDFYGAGNKT